MSMFDDNEPLDGEILPPGCDLDPERVSNLSMEFFRVINRHYATSPVGLTTVCEILNALAAVSGTIIAGTQEDGTAGGEAFFREALDLNIKIERP